jgi:hypothetical protein
VEDLIECFWKKKETKNGMNYNDIGNINYMWRLRTEKQKNTGAEKGDMKCNQRIKQRIEYV